MTDNPLFMSRVKITIKGSVQGVFFRYFIKNHATALGLNGYVRNVSDRVEAVLEGNTDKVKSLIKLCKTGPISSKISSIEIKDEIYKGEFRNFKIIY